MEEAIERERETIDERMRERMEEARKRERREKEREDGRGQKRGRRGLVPPCLPYSSEIAAASQFALMEAHCWKNTFYVKDAIPTST